MRKSWCILILLLTATDLWGQPQKGEPWSRVHEGSFSSNNAPMLPEYSSVTFSYDYADEERPRYMQEGDGLSQWRFQANSLKHLSDDSAVFGKIEYSNGTKRNVLWNTTSDFDLLFPYVLADSVGGDLRKEKYAFSGGCSHRTGRWLLGASGSYRALHEFRQVDPRPRNITSDFSIGGSAAYSIGEHYLDLTLLYRRYFQNQGVSFMNKRGANTSEFHLTGLGSHFGRFAGTTAYTSTYYRGQGFSAGISIFGRDRLSWSGGAKYSRFRAVRHLVNQNQAPITELYLNTLEVYADSRHFYPFAGTWEAYFSLAADFGWRQGRENVISNMSTGSFATLLSLPMYSRRALDATITGVLHKRGGALAFYPEIYWQSATAKHLFPVRNIDYGIASLSLRGGMETVRLSPLSSGGIFLMAGYNFSPSGSFSLPLEYTMPKLYEDYRSQFDVLTDNRLDIGVSAELKRIVFEGFSAGLGIKYRHWFYSGGYGADFLSAGLMLDF